MPKVELSIDAQYLAGSWGPFEGIRELIQNAKDADTEFGARMEVSHYKRGDQLRISNQGAVLSYEALLMGHTSKASRPDLIGKWGEGLKVGILALLREGYQIKIRTGSEVWVPAIERSEKFQAEVLVFDIRTGRKHQDRTRVEVSPVGGEDWAEWQASFLFLCPPKKKDSIQTTRGELLRAPEHKGGLYVKGILVERCPTMQYGYNFFDLEVDRDRRLVSSSDKEYHCSEIWNEALNREPALASDLYELLEEGRQEVAGLGWWCHSMVLETTQNLFLSKYGEKALPVQSLADSARLEHLGYRGIVVPRVLQRVLSRTLGNTEQRIAQLVEAARQRYSWQDLDATERANLGRAISLVRPHKEVSLQTLEIVDFEDECLEGQCDATGTIKLGKHILASAERTLRVLIHEVAHLNGAQDGDKSHVHAIEMLWSALFHQSSLSH